MEYLSYIYDLTGDEKTLVIKAIENIEPEMLEQTHVSLATLIHLSFSFYRRRTREEDKPRLYMISRYSYPQQLEYDVLEWTNKPTR